MEEQKSHTISSFQKAENASKSTDTSRTTALVPKDRQQADKIDFITNGKIDKWELRDAVSRRFAPIVTLLTGKERGKSIQSCGRYVISKREGVSYSQKGISGVALCRSWFCPVCAHKRAIELAEKLERGIQNGLADGEKYKFVTLTLPTDVDIALQQSLYAEAMRLWKQKMLTYVKSRREEFGKFAFSSSYDITIRSNGTHHLHIHGIAQAKKLPEDEVLQKLWNKSVQKSGELYALKLSPKKDACYIDDIKADDTKRASQYVAKYLGIASEISGGTSLKKNSFITSMTFGDLLQKLAVQTPLKKWIRSYKSLLEAFQGNRWTQIGRTMSKYAEMTEPEASDEEADEVESIAISWFSANSISSIRGASSKIIKEMKKENSPFIKKVRATNDEVSSLFGQAKHLSNDDWNRINKMWEECFGKSSKWWGYGAHDVEKNTS